MDDSIYTFVKQSETQYALGVEIISGWNWGMKEHIRQSILYKHGKFAKGNNDYMDGALRPSRNIVLPILNLQYRAEDIDLKDVVLYVDDSEKHHLSFLVKKYHDEVYTKEHDLDTFFDEAKEEKIDFGGVIVRNGKNGPVYEPLESIAFCDQTDILSGPIGFRMELSPEELYEKEALGWGDVSKGATTTIDELVTLAEKAKTDTKTGQKIATPGKYIEVYRVHGVLPARFLEGTKYTPKENERYVRQLQIVAYYKNSDGKNEGVTLYRAKETENPFKVRLRGKKIRNRALAFGGIEELFDPQIWTNYSEIQKKNMLDAASKVILQTTDDAYTSRNKIRDMENLEVTVTKEGTAISQVPNGSPNVQLFNQWINEWQVHAQTLGGATDALLGKNPSSGTPFRLENLVTQQGQGLHDYRKGKYATFIGHIYQDWIVPDITKKLSNGKKFLATLSADDMEYVVECLIRVKAGEYEKEKVLNGEIPYPEDTETFKQKVRDEFMRGGNKKFIEIFKDELKDVPIKVKVNISGKQKDLAGMVDKLVNMLRWIFSTYNQQTQSFAALDDPRMAKIVHKVIEYSGMDVADFAAYKPPTQPATQFQGQMPQIQGNQPVTALT